MPMFSVCSRCEDKIPFRGKCEKCEPIIRKEKNKEYRMKYDDTEIRKARHSVRWKKLRQRVIDEQKGLCLMCAVEQQYNPIDDVHHIVPANNDMSLFFDRDNLIGLCKEHHIYVHAHNLISRELLEEHLSNIVKDKREFK